MSRRWISLAIAAASGCAVAYGGSADLNGSFEEGRKGQPLHWELSGGAGAWEKEGRNGGRSISVTGDGKSSNYWKCPVELQSGLTYRVDFWTKAGPDATAGSVVSGTSECNMDWKPSREWTHRKIVFRAPDVRGERYLRFGQWNVRGSVYFDDVRIRPVTSLDSFPAGYQLGEGESIAGGEYGFVAPLAKGLNSARPVSRMTAGFNSNRWLFNGVAEVRFQHEIPRRKGAPPSFRHARVEVDIGYHIAGRLSVEASFNQTEWAELGEIEGVRSAEFTLPDSFDGHRPIWVRLRSAPREGEDRRCSFQVHGYRFAAAVNTEAGDLVGLSYYAMEEPRAFQRPEGWDRDWSGSPKTRSVHAKLTSVGAPSFGSSNTASVLVVSQLEQPIRVRAVVEIDSQKYEGALAKIEPGVRLAQTLLVAYRAGKSGQHAAHLSIVDAETNEALFHATWDYTVPALYDSGFGYVVEEGEACDLWWAGGPYKISRRCSMPEEKRRIEIAAAKGEYEPFQLVIAPKRDLKNLRLSVSDLRTGDDSRIPASAIEVCQVEYVNVTRPTDKIGCEGEWPDPLPPLKRPIDVSVKKGCQPLWFTIHVPRDAEAGKYRGAIALVAEDWKTLVPFSLTVWDFEIPRENHLKTAFGFSPGNVRRYHNLETEEEQRQVVDLYFKNFAEHRISPYDFAPFDPIRVRFPKSPDEPVELDFDGFDKQAERYLGPDYRFTTFRLRLSGMGGGTFHSRHPGRIGKWEQGSPEYEKVFADYLKQLESHLREKGWLEEAFCYWFDEPDPKDYDFVRDGMQRIHRAAPGLLRMLTEQPETKLDGVTDIWCPLTPRVTPELTAREHEKGREVWWYICTGPKGPYCTLFIDHYGIEFRMWSWQTWKTGVDGLLIWQSNYWTSNAAYPPPAMQNPWEDPMSWRSGYDNKPGDKRPWGNGDGRFVYPPNRNPANDKTKYLEGPVNSIRWEMLREGIEDYEYFWLLRDQIAKARKAGKSAKAIEQAERLLEIPESITKDHTHFTKDPRDLYQYRQRLAEAIVALSRL